MISQVADHLFNTKKISKQVSIKKAFCLAQDTTNARPNVTEHIFGGALLTFFYLSRNVNCSRCL